MGELFLITHPYSKKLPGSEKDAQTDINSQIILFLFLIEAILLPDHMLTHNQ
jgi:hypothetical protein